MDNALAKIFGRAKTDFEINMTLERSCCKYMSPYYRSISV